MSDAAAINGAPAPMKPLDPQALYEALRPLVRAAHPHIALEVMTRHIAEIIVVRVPPQQHKAALETGEAIVTQIRQINKRRRALDEAALPQSRPAE